ncbi:histone-lysine N-methyltransferase EZA1-like isoform X1 [Juglans microcarpa x Juglans regia]|uniref:histone-lysine N-methyltransferase EZA1-like isoform X1 n=2 Tax=Juglans microcarpa x Juglans regia TaxID=2249226 RepID=UPI001B7DE1AE|nr:histone-lysine N-methyltransferase EZA1-like isoform X1 [Juglans microcarpa x Juglans regia]
MVSKKPSGEQSIESLGALSYNINQLKKQIEAERIVSIKEKLVKNGMKLESHVSQVILVASKTEVSLTENGVGKMLSSRTERPICKFNGSAQGFGDKDYINVHEVVLSTSIKLPPVERLPPYTTWIFLDRNQRMAEDQSVVGRRRIYYDQHGGEALVCSDSEDDITERVEEKHEFSEGEDRILWMAFQEHGLGEEVFNILSQIIGGTTLEIQERYNTLKEKYHKKLDLNSDNSEEFGPDVGLSLDKSLSAALDSFDNLFCRRCMLFDCRLHGCSQALIYPTEKQSYWSDHEEDRIPCSAQCYLQLRAVKDMPEISTIDDFQRMEHTNSEERVGTPVSCNAEERGSHDNANIIQEEGCIFGKSTPVISQAVCSSEAAATISNVNVTAIDNQRMGKHNFMKNADMALHDSTLVSDDFQGSSKKQKMFSAPEVVTITSEAPPAQNHTSSDNGESQTTLKCSAKEPDEHTLNEFVSSFSASSDRSEDDARDEIKDTRKVPELNQSSNSVGKSAEGLGSSEWKPIEKELYLKGIEMFGRNSCLIARNLLSGLKTCMEVSCYMHEGGALTPNRSIVSPSSLMEDNGKADMEYTDHEMPARSRLLRRRGKTRKFKYSWKSAGHPSIWKRIADGKNQSCKQYTPCGCQSMCGKQCPCLHNGTCCEKYCGCSKSCKNRFRGCHCAKSQCRSRQCPCFAAGRECDPDVCRNCWVSCGDSSLGEPPRQGDSQCGNMRLLLRQQQRILLAKSDIAGWGAFLKKPVNKNDYLGEYTGELISHREADKRGKIYDRANSSFLFDLNDQFVLDAYRKGDKLKFANHSSNPNCYAKVMLVAGDHRVGIFAKERIEASEELFYDYRYGPDQAPAWARKPESSKRDDSLFSQGRAKKHQSH